MEDFAMTYLIVATLLISAAGFFVIGKRMGAGTLGPNSWVGIRTPHACKSEENWYATQSRCAPFVVLLSFISLDSAILFVIQGAFAQSIPFLVPTVVMIAQMVLGVYLLCRAALT